MMRMWWFTLGRDTVGGNRTGRLPLSAYAKGFYLFPLHFMTQKRYAQCKRKRPWAVHLAIMLSYLTMLILIMFFLKRMWAGPAIDWRVHVFGYLASAGIVIRDHLGASRRIKKVEEHYKHSHESDWMFLILLMIVALTGVLQHILHRSGADVAANVSYVVHLMAVVPCWDWRCRSASGLTWRTGRWPCTCRCFASRWSRCRPSRNCRPTFRPKSSPRVDDPDPNNGGKGYGYHQEDDHCVQRRL